MIEISIGDALCSNRRRCRHRSGQIQDSNKVRCLTFSTVGAACDFGAIKRAVSLASLAIVAGCASKAEPPPAPPPAEVGVFVVGTQNVALTTELVGRTVAFETSEVRPQVSGLIQARLFTEGSIVRQGQIL